MRGRLQAAPIPIPVLSGCSCVFRASRTAQLLLDPGTASALGTQSPLCQENQVFCSLEVSNITTRSRVWPWVLSFSAFSVSLFSPGKSELPGRARDAHTELSAESPQLLVSPSSGAGTYLHLKLCHFPLQVPPPHLSYQTEVTESQTVRLGFELEGP